METAVATSSLADLPQPAEGLLEWHRSPSTSASDVSVDSEGNPVVTLEPRPDSELALALAGDLMAESVEAPPATEVHAPPPLLGGAASGPTCCTGDDHFVSDDDISSLCP